MAELKTLERFVITLNQLTQLSQKKKLINYFSRTTYSCIRQIKQKILYQILVTEFMLFKARLLNHHRKYLLRWIGLSMQWLILLFHEQGRTNKLFSCNNLMERTYWTCDCGKTVLFTSRYAHLKSQVHLQKLLPPIKITHGKIIVYWK